MAVHPLGADLTVLPSRLKHDTSRSPLDVPAGLVIVRWLSAVVSAFVACVCRMIPGGGGADTVILVVVEVLLPPAFDAVKVTLYVPAAAYVLFGLCSVDVVLSPKSHAHDVGAPVEVSVNDTSIGATPEVADAVKLAVETGTASCRDGVEVAEVPLPP